MRKLDREFRLSLLEHGILNKSYSAMKKLYKDFLNSQIEVIEGEIVDGIKLPNIIKYGEYEINTQPRYCKPIINIKV